MRRRDQVTETLRVTAAMAWIEWAVFLEMTAGEVRAAQIAVRP